MLSEKEISLRLTGLGGSDIGAAVGLSQYRSPLDVYQEKIGEGKAFEGNEATFWGNVLEPVIAERYRIDEEIPIDCYLSPGSRRVEGREWQIISPDRIVLDPETRTKKKVAEIKTAGKWGAMGFGEEGSDELPETYLCQGAWYMSGEDVDRCDFPSLLTTNDYRVLILERDRELEDYLLEEGEKFWKRVVDRRPPDPDGSRSFARYIQNRFPLSTTTIRPPTAEADQIAANLRSVMAMSRVIEKQKKILQQQIAMIVETDKGIETADGKITFSNVRGKVNHSAVALALANRLGLEDPALKSIQEKNRFDSYRKINTPRSWSQDRIAANPEGLKENVREIERTASDRSDGASTSATESAPS